MGNYQVVERDEVWSPLLREGGSPTVHSSFDNALNLLWEGELLTLLPSHGRRAPAGAITELSVLPQFEAGFSTRFVDDVLQIGDLYVAFGGSNVFSCQVPRAAVPDSYSVDPSMIEAANTLLRDLAPSGSFLRAAIGTPWQESLTSRLQRAQRQWRQYLRGELSASEAVNDLVGLGAGLTPSGDDYLVGALAVLFSLPTTSLPGVDRAEVMQAIFDRLEQTTDISAHFLRAATNGRFHFDIAAAARALLRGEDVHEPFQQVLAFGSTSGADTLFGLIDTAQILAGDPPTSRKELEK